MHLFFFRKKGVLPPGSIKATKVFQCFIVPSLHQIKLNNLDMKITKKTLDYDMDKEEHPVAQGVVRSSRIISKRYATARFLSSPGATGFYPEEKCEHPCKEVFTF
jgi:hypothetical protein